MSKTYELYKKDRECSKCGCGAIDDMYHKDSCPIVAVNQIFYGEHIHRICTNCGYEWAEMPLGEGRE